MGNTKALGSKASSVHKSTGPRTGLGKFRSQRNATKHAIFSKLAVVKGESETELNVLKNGLNEYFKPVGMFEAVLVDTIVTTLWRQRRVLIAERAEIESGRDFLEWDERHRQLVDAGTVPAISDDGGLMRKIANAEVREACLFWLNTLKRSIEKRGFYPDEDATTLAVLYGYSDDGFHWQEDLTKQYSALSSTAGEPDDVRKRNNLSSPEECKTIFLDAIDSEIGTLASYQKEQEEVESHRLKLNSLRQAIPDSLGFDRLLRYSTKLERTLDRTLSQLERAQALRRGHPVLAPVKVDISST
jgi:hypothetical protein